MDLTQKKCVACEGWMKPLTRKEFTPLLKQVKSWQVREGKAIEKAFEFKNFKAALAFVNRVGSLAEEEGHHPNIFLHGWNKVLITLSTHAIKGLSENDFILATKIDRL